MEGNIKTICEDTVAEKGWKGRVNDRDLLKILMGVLHDILTHHWVDAFIQSALQVERVLTFLL